MKRVLLFGRVGTITEEDIEKAKDLGDYLVVGVLMDGYKSKGETLKALTHKSVGDILMAGSLEEAVRISCPDVYIFLGKTKEISKEDIDRLILVRES